MKTLQELYKEVLASNELRTELAAELKENSKEAQEKLKKFLEKHNVKCSKEELLEFLKTKFKENGELSKDELDMVTGGCSGKEAASSIFSLGIICIVDAIASAVDDNYTNGKTANSNKLLCHPK